MSKLFPPIDPDAFVGGGPLATGPELDLLDTADAAMDREAILTDAFALVDRRRARRPLRPRPRPRPHPGPRGTRPHLGQSLLRRLAPQRGPSTRRRPSPRPSLSARLHLLYSPLPPPPGRRRSVRRTNALWSSTPSSARLATGQALPRSDRTPIRWRSARAAGGPIPPRPSWTRKSSAHRTSGGIRQRSVSGLKSVGARWRRLRLWGFSS